MLLENNFEQSDKFVLYIVNKDNQKINLKIKSPKILELL
jgi:hypothetical protein